MQQDIISELAPTGVLRAAINTGNGLLVTGFGASGEPQGVAPDIAAEVAARLGVRLILVSFPRPSILADAADTGVWDIGLIGAEPERAEKIAFSPAYCEIEATYLVPAGSPFKTVADVDRENSRIAVRSGSAYCLWLERNIKRATLRVLPTAEGPLEEFAAGELEALAGLRPGLLQELPKFPGARILEGNFSTVQQAIGTARRNTAGARFLHDFVEEAKASGLVSRLIDRHAVHGLSVAPLVHTSN